jgi:metallophosphoesterase (TIGR00282 family)
MRILCIGDVMGEPGRKAVKHLLPKLIQDERIDFVIANGENVAGGFGLTQDSVKELFNAGVDVITGGNHSWDKKEIIDVMKNEPRILRPANYSNAPGAGHYLATGKKGHKVGVVNVMGRVFMYPLEDPFKMALELVKQLRRDTRVLVVDVHAEATSEKQAMGWFLNGHCSIVFGTHTHVQTADERLLPGGTAFITDAGLTGPLDSVIGMKKEFAIERFLTGMPTRLEVAKGNTKLQGILVDVDEESGRATAIKRIQEAYNPQ